jgi:DNA-directed RNA polymerase specialized sigma24 family protein
MMTDTALFQRFKADPERGYHELLDQYTPVILRMIRRFVRDPDEVMETYTAICERLRTNDYSALRRFRENSALTPWLSVVVANACRDRFRKFRTVSAPESVLSQLTDRERLVFRYYFQERLLHSDIAIVLQSRHRIRCTEYDVARDLDRIDDLLSVAKRWHLLAAIRANLPVLAFEDLTDGSLEHSELAVNPDALSEGPDEKLLQRLNDAVKTLDPDDQLLLLMRFEQGMRANDIARAMQFENPKYVYTRLRTVVGKLRRLMGVEVPVGNGNGKAVQG